MWFPVNGLSLRAAAGYTLAELTEAAPAAGGLDGDRLPFVPKLTGSLGANYRWSVMNNWTAFAGGSVNYVGERHSDFSQRADVNVPSYTTLNLNAGIENANWRMSMYVKNLNDSRGITFVKSMTLSPAGSPFGAGVIAPRTIGIEAGYRF